MPEMLQRVSEGKKEKPLTNWKWRGFAEQKVHRGRLWNTYVECGNIFAEIEME